MLKNIVNGSLFYFTYGQHFGQYTHEFSPMDGNAKNLKLSKVGPTMSYLPQTHIDQMLGLFKE